MNLWTVTALVTLVGAIAFLAGALYALVTELRRHTQQGDDSRMSPGPVGPSWHARGGR